MHDIETRSAENDDSLYLEGYFSVYNETYEVGPGITESIAPGAFAESIHQDVRALYNHNTDLILGRVSAGTLMLEDRERGLWGRIKINKNDTEAMNVYNRIARGDVSGCSFGFGIEKESQTVSDDGSVHFTIERVNPLVEISPCVLPAYEATSISARSKQVEEIRKRLDQAKSEAWKERILKKLKGDK